LAPELADADAGFATLRSADAFAKSHNWPRTFAGEEELENHAQKPLEVVLLVRRFDKEEVVKAGVTGHLLPCKTSMHTIDPRPVAVDIPLDDLEAGSRKTLAKRLDEKRFELLPPGSVYEGRRYRERILLLSAR
jgi:hypothetical protein